MKFFLFWLAVAGWMISVTVHVLSVFDIAAQEKFPFVWGLHIGIFIVIIPAILQLRKRPELLTQKRMGALGLFKILAETAPIWIVVIAVIGLAYAFVNFFLFFGSGAEMGTPAAVNGQYSLQNHGKFIRYITEQEYHHYMANAIRGFSGHWIAFYGMAAAMLYPYKKDKTLSEQNPRPSLSL